jgi:toxin-antitoxin system PIN domain toxin
LIAFDTNILLYAFDTGAPAHDRARAFITECAGRDNVTIAELVLVDYYGLLRNVTIFANPLSPESAVVECERYRRHPKWRLVENAPVMEKVWQHARGKDFARRRIFDVRLALTLQHHGVTDFATANTKDFQGLGFKRVWDPTL